MIVKLSNYRRNPFLLLNICLFSLQALTKTIDQAKAVMSFLDAISEKTLKSTVSLTAARGRGKSAAIGLCLAGAVSYGEYLFAFVIGFLSFALVYFMI